MESQPNYTLIGLFVIGFLAGLLAFIIWIARLDVEGQSATYDIYFEGSVTGLRVNEQVRYHGLPIGYITSLEVDRHNPELIKVRVKISEPSLIREDTIASIEAKGLTGYSYIQIVGGNRDSPLLKRKKDESYPRIKSRQSKIEELFSDAPKVLRRLHKLTGTLNQFFDKETKKALNDALLEAREAARSITATFKQIESQTAHFAKDFHTITQNVDQTSKDFRGLMQGIQSVVEKNKDAVEIFTNVSLYKFTRLISETNQTMQGLSRMIEQVEKSPADFIHKNLNTGVSIE